MTDHSGGTGVQVYRCTQHRLTAQLVIKLTAAPASTIVNRVKEVLTASSVLS